ncbi:MAG: FAD-dependent oxidoreductase [Planctomycetes bacterium]|nr:FAD-dependent oxidoreductase [Planctomycetota bacterium]
MNPERRRAFVLGGGVAGLAASFALADRGFAVELLESRRQLGGRAFSSPDKVTGERLDNGAHVMLGCYASTRRLLRRLGTEQGFQQDPSLRLAFRSLSPAPRTLQLRLSRLPVPLAMPLALLGLGLGWGARLRALRGMLTSVLGAPPDRTLAQWFDRRGQRGEPASFLWQPLCRAVMNVEPEDAAAMDFLATLREAFSGSARSAAFWVPLRPWGELFGDPAPQALAAAGVALHCGVRVTGLEVQDHRVAAILGGDGRRREVGPRDVVVSALPWNALAMVLGERFRQPFAALESSPIVTVYCALRDGAAPPPDDGPVVALVDGAPFHFLLRRPGEAAGRFALLSGGDRSLDGCAVDEITARAAQQLRRYYPGVDVDGATLRVRKEQRATFVAAPGSHKLRPDPGRLTPVAGNLWICGDWTATGLPATLEGAARSGEAVVAAIERD